MELYLVQHGAAKSEAEDPQRGLTEEGRKSVERVARFARGIGIRVRMIEHSEKLRARQTAEILAQQLSPAEGIRQISGINPKDDVAPMGARLAGAETTLMLVGHLPYLSRLVSRLVGVPPERTTVQFQMGGIVRLDRDPAGQWSVRWVLPPEVLPE